MEREKKFELCIVGSGPAGIILTLEFAKKNPEKSIVLVEFGKGKVARNSLDDSIEIKDTQNHHSVYECTNKGFGGTSTTWGGRCVPYDEVDFMDRTILNGGCTWDLSINEEVKAFLPSAAEYFECGKADFNLEELREHQNTSIAEGFIKGTVSDSSVERWSMPTRFARRYSRSIKEAQNLTLM
ncbi:MAG TPA: GMC family oxidoreductase, partial [Salinimicrobium sp.]|nr:GMC family oxidoreductase [Salinimicrobium sp.]